MRLGDEVRQRWSLVSISILFVGLLVHACELRASSETGLSERPRVGLALAGGGRDIDFAGIQAEIHVSLGRVLGR